MENKTPLFLGIAAIAVIGIAAFTFTSNQFDSGSKPSETAPAATAGTGGQPTGDSAASAAGGSAITSRMADGAAQDEAYRDGTYSATGNYQSPAGAEEIDVTLTVAGGSVTEVVVVPKADNPISRRWQEATRDAIAEQVIGKKLEEISVDTVSGSSLTPDGFMEALDEIRARAQG